MTSLFVSEVSPDKEKEQLPSEKTVITLIIFIFFKIFIDQLHQTQYPEFL